PWLLKERLFIQQSISSGKYILGICLGAQLIARASGAEVVKNDYREIGWFDINIEQENLPALLNDVFKQSTEVFHWHGDTFEIPEAALHFASSEACANQGFILNDRVIGLQFHIETTESSAALLVENCRDELDGSTYVQSEAEILADSTRFNRLNRLLSRLLENIALA
ncbi:MAG: type 1 glutamine amidotransferase, partial [Pseudomonadota bacterium]|nr:type 1 glutamine amidotransferase [Pseudomonadota bacterium]